MKFVGIIWPHMHIRSCVLESTWWIDELMHFMHGINLFLRWRMTGVDGALVLLIGSALTSDISLSSEIVLTWDDEGVARITVELWSWAASIPGEVGYVNGVLGLQFGWAIIGLDLYHLKKALEISTWRSDLPGTAQY